MDYLNKYLKYKQKYINLKKLKGGTKDYYLPCEICHCTKRMYIRKIDNISKFNFDDINYILIKGDDLFPQDPRIIFKSYKNDKNYLFAKPTDELIPYTDIEFLEKLNNSEDYPNKGGNYISSPYDKNKIFCINNIYFPINQENINFFKSRINQELIELECSFEGHIDEMMCFMPYGIDKYKIWFYDEIQIDQLLDHVDARSIIMKDILIKKNIDLLHLLKNLSLPFRRLSYEEITSEFKQISITNTDDINFIIDNVQNNNDADLYNIINNCTTRPIRVISRIFITIKILREYTNNKSNYNKEKLVEYCKVNKIFNDNLLINKFHNLIIENLENNDIKNLLEDIYNDYIACIFELYNDPELTTSDNIEFILEKINSKVSRIDYKNDILLSLSYKNRHVKQYLCNLLNQQRERNISKICKALEIDIDHFVFFPLNFKSGRNNLLSLENNRFISLKNPTVFNRIFYESDNSIYCFISLGSDEVYNLKITELVKSEKPNIKSFIDSKEKTINFIYINTQESHDSANDIGNGGNLHCLSKQIYE